jgi:hypothetical protein
MKKPCGISTQGFFHVWRYSMQIHIVYCGKDAQIQSVFGMQPFSKTSAFVALAAGNHAVAAAEQELETRHGCRLP